MKVIKLNGQQEEVQLDKVTKRVRELCKGLTVDPIVVSQKVGGGLFDGISTTQIDELCILTASYLVNEDPDYGKLAARLLSSVIDKEIKSQEINSFLDSVKVNFENGIINKPVYDFVKKNHVKLGNAIKPQRDFFFDYFGLKTVFDRYLLRGPETRLVTENAQYFFMRVACGLASNTKEAIELYDLMSSLDYLASTPTLFNSATTRTQMSSCYLLDSPADNLEAIYDKYKDVAMLSKWAGGIGLSYSRLRGEGTLIKGTNAFSNGIVPFLKTMDSSVASVNQGGRRKGSACIYLETWHPDIESFLELRDNTGDHERRTHNLNLANWIPDLFMKRVKQNEMWSLIDPSICPELVDLVGEQFERAYVLAESRGLYKKQIKAVDLYARMMKTLAETGNGWMTFKDTSNRKSNQTKNPENVIHNSNLCVEILEVTSKDQTAVCNLGSINLSNHVTDGVFDFPKLAATVKSAIKYLDRVIDVNFYPIASAAASNKKWRPVGLGLMGLQDVFFKLGLTFDSSTAKELSTKISEEIYYNALTKSMELAKSLGAHENFADTRAASGVLQFDLWGITPQQTTRWENLRQQIIKHGLRNSLVIAIAPTATIASIVGCYECIEPQMSNLFKRETLSGEFLQINKYLVTELKRTNLWTQDVRDLIKIHNGSVQKIEALPQQLRDLFRTAWEVPMRSLIDMAADRGAFIDQSQSLNLFMESPTIGKCSSMYMYAWERGLKTTYYLRSRSATSIAKTTVAAAKTEVSSEAAILCSLENPEACESCQ